MLSKRIFKCLACDGGRLQKVQNDLQEYWAELPSVGFLKHNLQKVISASFQSIRNRFKTGKIAIILNTESTSI